MSIRPVVFGGMMQSTAEIGNQQASVENRPSAEQMQVASTLQNQEMQESQQVNTTENMSDSQYQYGQGGSGKREAENKDQKKDKKKKEMSGDGKVMLKGSVPSFDIKI